MEKVVEEIQIDSEKMMSCFHEVDEKYPVIFEDYNERMDRVEEYIKNKNSDEMDIFIVWLKEQYSRLPECHQAEDPDEDWVEEEHETPLKNLIDLLKKYRKQMGKSTEEISKTVSDEVNNLGV